MGCCTEPATVHIAHVLQTLYFFQVFNFFLIYTAYRNKKNYTHLLQKKITRLDGFFVHNLHFSRGKMVSRSESSQCPVVLL